ncbi:hypothetical protein V8E54_006159 [Elaphomyces granulatus]
MDSHDVPHLDRYIQLLDQQKKTLNAAYKVRQGERPEDRKSRLDLVNNFEMNYTVQQMCQLRTRQLRMSTAPTEMLVHSSFLPPPYLPSIAPLGELKQTFIDDLRIETHHRGKYLLLRSITPPNRMTAIMAIVEDEREDAVMLQLYQQDDKKDRPATSILKQNDIVIVKEPYFKVMADGEYGLRVDHVSDLVWIDPCDKRIPLQWTHLFDLNKTADDWKQEGNEAMRIEQYWAAVRNYTTALGRPASLQERKTAQLNRALAYLKNGAFDAALVDTECLTSSSDAPEKALYRAGQALYELGRFSECQDILQSLCEKYPNNVSAAMELERVRCRLEEQKSGIYDFKAIQEKMSRDPPPRLDHATFIGPVTVKASMGRGRGLFTTKAVKAGDLILCEKAFAHCYVNTKGKLAAESSGIGLRVNVHTNRMTTGRQGDLITRVVQKLWRNPSLLPEFMALHQGSYEPVDVIEVDGKPIIDTFLVERIVSLNCFGCPISSLKTLELEDPHGEMHHSCGVWLKASYINHSCLCNVRRSFIGDLQLVHATRDIPPDTELTFWYRTLAGGSYEERQESLKNWGFECDCPICLDAKNTPKKVLEKRDALHGDLKTALDAVVLDVAKTERLLAAIELTYKIPASEVSRLALWAPYLRLMHAYVAENQLVKLLASALKGLECLGFVIKGANPLESPDTPFEVVQWGVVIDTVIEAWMHLWTTYAILAPHLCQKAEDCAIVTYRICIGEDVTFEESFGRKIREAVKQLV